ncbi:MAG: VWA domain-containing protein [Jaaginema sp. PMC 1079.18]|nr:VWA domain-containing protein [Jaaginema sp. PMC 1080.18]MEC4849841.1 VWA domain-containing protein [Jaaginema sp. PMC 1079.18]MEC4864554.1 VWA domain-containing protein [Jaaginema sp. PMC 1078.18]
MTTNTALNQVDICFIVDTTGSMGGFITAAKQQLLDAIGVLSGDRDIDLQVGLVEYRDHPPQDKMITRVYPLKSNLQRLQKAITNLQADGGGDGAEAVYQGVYDACTQMQWRTHSCRFGILVGDAPPHGFPLWWQDRMGENLRYGSDAWQKGCPSGLDVDAVTAIAEKRRIKLYSLCMGRDDVTQKAFSAIASFTGGEGQVATEGSSVVEKIISVLTQEFQNLEFDRQVLEMLLTSEQFDVEELAKILDSSPYTVANSVGKLRQRGFV